MEVGSHSGRGITRWPARLVAFAAMDGVRAKHRQCATDICGHGRGSASVSGCGRNESNHRCCVSSSFSCRFNFFECSVQWAVFNSCSTEWFGLKCGEIFDLRSNFFMTRRFRAFRRCALSRKRIEASSCRYSIAPRWFHSQPKYNAAAKRIIISPSIGIVFGNTARSSIRILSCGAERMLSRISLRARSDRDSQLPYLKDNSTRVR